MIPNGIMTGKKGITVEMPKPPETFNVDNGPVELVKARLQQITEDIQEIEQALVKRGEIGSSVIASARAKVVSLQHDLRALPPFNYCQDHNLQARRTNIERELETLERELRQEEVAMWRDSARLEEEARRLRREQRAALRRMELINHAN